MSEVLDLKHRLNKNYGKKKNGLIVVIIIIVLAVALTTVGIKASDSLFGAKGQVKSLCPDGMVFVPGSNGGFCLDKYEDSAGTGCQLSDPSNEQDSKNNIDNPNCQAVSVAGAVPWRNLTQIQAINLCAKAGKHLPTSEEWFAGSVGTPDKNSLWGLDDCQVNNNWSQQPGLTGSGKNCVSYAGAYDMIGNVWEWVAGAVKNGKYQSDVLPDEGYIKGADFSGIPTDTNQNQPDSKYNNDYLWIKNIGSRGIARGGYWSNGDQAGQYSAYIVTLPSDIGPGMGFRCAK